MAYGGSEGDVHEHIELCYGQREKPGAEEGQNLGRAAEHMHTDADPALREQQELWVRRGRPVVVEDKHAADCRQERNEEKLDGVCIVLHMLIEGNGAKHALVQAKLIRARGTPHDSTRLSLQAGPLYPAKKKLTKPASGILNFAHEVLTKMRNHEIMFS